MKIALCFHGYFLNSGGMNAAFASWEYLRRKVYSHGKIDVFFHCWDQGDEARDMIKNMYDPIKVQYETQKDFKEEIKSLNQAWFDEGFDRDSTMYKGNSIFQTLSFLYSRKRALELKSEHEEENNFKYDVVILARTDIGTRGKEHKQKHHVTNIHFDPNLDMQQMHVAYWDQTNWGYPDHWFYSNSKNMDILGTAYDKIQKYYSPDSDYVQSVTTGWFDSNAEDEFSNEQMKPIDQRSQNLVVFDRWQCIDNHKLYKWFFKDVGLYEKTNFIDISGG
jgi:hypothetical protein